MWKNPYSQIFNDGILAWLQPDELEFGDAWYTHVSCISPGTDTVEKKRVHMKLGARHQAVNLRFKKSNWLRHILRHEKYLVFF